MAYKIRPQVLDKIRALHGFTSDEQLAHGMGLSLGTISRIRRGAVRRAGGGGGSAGMVLGRAWVSACRGGSL